MKRNNNKKISIELSMNHNSIKIPLGDLIITLDTLIESNLDDGNEIDNVDVKEYLTEQKVITEIIPNKFKINDDIKPVAQAMENTLCNIIDNEICKIPHEYFTNSSYNVKIE